MFEIDFLRAGEKKDADAICMRFDRPDGGGRAVVVLDAGWKDDGESVVDFVKDRYGTTKVDLAIVSHPDGDHIGGMGHVVRELDVAELAIHRLDQRGGAGLKAGSAVAELADLASRRSTLVAEPFEREEYLGGVLTVLGPSTAYYAELVEEQKTRAQKKQEQKAAPTLLAALRESAQQLGERVITALPVEIPFGEGSGPGPRNNSSTVILFELGDFRALLTGDAGVPAIDAALNYAEGAGIDAISPKLIQIPHHGSRRNASSALLDRVLGPIGGALEGNAYVSVCGKSDPKHPAGRVVNAYVRRGYTWNWTAGDSIRRSSPDAPPRHDYGPIQPMPPLEELPDED